MKKEILSQLLDSNENLIIKDVLPFLKANRYTFYNLDSEAKKIFKKYYKCLLKKQNNPVKWIHKMLIKNILNDEKLILDYVVKFKIIEVLLQFSA